MNRERACAVTAAILLLSACERTIAPADDAGPGTGGNSQAAPPSEPVAPRTASPAAAPPMTSPVGNRVNDGYPDLTPSALTPEAERTETGARNLLISFTRAIELQEFDQAWELLSATDRRTWPKADFARKFADLSEITVVAPDGTMEGAAGASYYTAPLTITATDRAGRPIRYEGEAVLRRANDVAGADPAQLRWRFDRLTLDWTH